MGRYLSVWSPNWAITTWRRRHPDAWRPDEAFALVETEKTARRLRAVNDAARVAGLFPGMKLTDALAVHPALLTAPAEPETEVEALQALADWCVRYSPAVAMDAPDGLFLEVSGSEALWGRAPPFRHSRAEEGSEATDRGPGNPAAPPSTRVAAGIAQARGWVPGPPLRLRSVPPGHDERNHSLDASSTAEAAEAALLADLLTRLEAQGIPAFGAVAATPGAAWALARFSAPFRPAARGRSRPAASSPRSEARQDPCHDLLPQEAIEQGINSEHTPAPPSEPGFANRSGDLARDLAEPRAGPDGRVKPLARRAAQRGLEAADRLRSLDGPRCADALTPPRGGGGDALLSPRLRGDEAGASRPKASSRGAQGSLSRQAAPPPGCDGLAPLPVAALRLDPETEAGLTRLGLKTIGQVLALPRAQLGRRLGQKLLLRLDQATGAIRETPPWRRAPAPWFERLALVEPISTPEDLARTTGDILEKLCARLEREGQGARRFHLTFHRLDGKMATLSVGTTLAGREAARLARLFGPKLETVDPGFGVEVATLEAERVEPLAGRQIRLAETGEADLDPDLARAAVAELVDRLQARLGEDSVWRPTVRETWTPERAVARSAPFATARPERGWDPARPRPIRLFPRPEPIEATAPVPDDPPVQFRWRGRLHRVRAAEGPERIAEEWWRKPIGEVGPDRVRDYYRVEDADGARFWIFRAGLYAAGTPSRWFVHGLFG